MARPITVFSLFVSILKSIKVVCLCLKQVTNTLLPRVDASRHQGGLGVPMTCTAVFFLILTLVYYETQQTNTNIRMNKTSQLPRAGGRGVPMTRLPHAPYTGIVEYGARS